ncbi:hypothetical protein HPP92_028705 [Vanilla planifolia]|uniref:non-specific serine/threonine protein kinase n=1 Tax=Vanilla planifolia TaxID=51239 RepID=A0A835P543_VANPL|nr:hypothetical protein HPP92_028705 [Vanilla planifolia]
MSTAPKVKRFVGGYELGRTIGEGTFAKVRFARNTQTGEPVAIKILAKEKVLKHKLVEQIEREIAIMKLIKHPNVVRLQEVMGSKSKIFIVLEYVTGGELFDKILENLLLDEFWQPEGFLIEAMMELTADLWSCGVILLYYFAGYFPFDDNNLMNLYNKSILSPKYRRMSGLEKGYKPPIFDETYNNSSVHIDAGFTKDLREKLDLHQMLSHGNHQKIGRSYEASGYDIQKKKLQDDA